MYIKTLNDLAHTLTAWVDSFEREKVKFAEKLDSDPVNAIRWSGALIQEAPRYALAKFYLSTIFDRETDIAEDRPVIDEQKTLKRIRDNVLARVLQGARRPAASSNHMSNVVEAYETAAYSDLLNLFGPVEAR